MLKISATQIDKFTELFEAEFFQRAMVHLSNFDPHGFGLLEAVDQNKFIQDINNSAKNWSVERESELILFGEICCMLGEDFLENETHDWAHRLLAESSSDMHRTLEYIRDTALVKTRHGVVDNA